MIRDQMKDDLYKLTYKQQSKQMGNKQHGQNDDFHKMIQEMRHDQSRRVSINPEKKYLSLMKDTLLGVNLPETLKGLIEETLEEKVSQVELIQTVTCINALKNNEFESTAPRSHISTRERPQSKFVKVNFGEGFLAKMFGRLRISQKHEFSAVSSPQLQKPALKRSHSSSSQDEQDRKKEQEQKIKVITQVMRKELNRIMHPFGKLNKAFAEYIEGSWKQFAPLGCSEDYYQKSVRKLIADWCSYLEVGCLGPYRKWIMGYTGMQEKKFATWIRNLLLQQIWVVNSGYLFSMLATVINRCKTPLDIDFKELQESAALLTPSLFQIDDKLQIQGHFFDSIYEMSEIVSRYRPQKILTQLQTVKKRVCTDIDNYHRLVEVKDVYEIDSDNILGIVAYILCKIASRIDQIHTHLIFLRIVYTDKVYYNMGLGSYMLSTVFGAMEFLEGEHFHHLLEEKKGQQPNKPKIQVVHSDTKEGTSVREDVSQADLNMQSLVVQPDSHGLF